MWSHNPAPQLLLRNKMLRTRQWTQGISKRTWSSRSRLRTLLDKQWLSWRHGRSSDKKTPSRQSLAQLLKVHSLQRWIHQTVKWEEMKSTPGQPNEPQSRLISMVHRWRPSPWISPWRLLEWQEPIRESMSYSDSLKRIANHKRTNWRLVLRTVKVFSILQ